MAKISESHGRSDENSGYTRLFGNSELGHLMSRVQAAVIRAGNELEDIVERTTLPHLKSSLDHALESYETSRPTIQVVFQAIMPAEGDEPGGRADVAIFNHSARAISVIELKDGDTFDTKKSSGELESMVKFAEWISVKTGFSATFYFCSFNQDSKEAIVRGAKGRFDISHAMTGRELCQILGIDYDSLRAKRQDEQPENLHFFLRELLKIPQVRQIILAIIGSEE